MAKVNFLKGEIVKFRGSTYILEDYNDFTLTIRSRQDASVVMSIDYLTELEKSNAIERMSFRKSLSENKKVLKKTATKPRKITIIVPEAEDSDRQLDMIGRLIKFSKGGSVEYNS